MPLLPFGEYRPDVNNLDGHHSRAILNVLPQGDGYGPLQALAAFSQALGAQCRGYFYAQDDAGEISIFAATSTKLYKLDNTYLTWTDASAGAGTYTTISDGALWQFAQFGSFVIAVQANDDVQVYQLGVSSAFADLAGSPPDAAYVSVVNRFLVLSGLTANPKRIQWSGLNEITNWASGSNSSDFQDFPDGGNVRQVIGGDVGVIQQDNAFRRMLFSAGSEAVFQIDRIAKDIGVLHPYGTCGAGDKVFVLTTKGFMQMTPDGTQTPIGAEKVDRTFLASYDSSAPGYVQAAADPKRHTVLFTYRANGGSTDGFDSCLGYNWLLQRWFPVMITGEVIAPLATPGLTLEGLDALAPGALVITGAVSAGGLIKLTVASTASLTTGDNKTISGVVGTTEANATWDITVVNGTTFTLDGSTFTNAYISGGIVGGSVDAMTTSFDFLSTGSLPNISVCDTAHKVGFFSGDNLEATVETPETSGDGQRILVKGFWPQTDAATVYGTIGKRENLNATPSYLNESTMNSDGFVPLLWSTRYARGKLRIPSGTLWTYASGVRPESQPDGMN